MKRARAVIVSEALAEREVERPPNFPLLRSFDYGAEPVPSEAEVRLRSR